MGQRALAVSLSTLFAVAALGGCGGGGASQSAPTTTTTTSPNPCALKDCSPAAIAAIKRRLESAGATKTEAACIFHAAATEKPGSFAIGAGQTTFTIPRPGAKCVRSLTRFNAIWTKAFGAIAPLTLPSLPPSSAPSTSEGWTATLSAADREIYAKALQLAAGLTPTEAACLAALEPTPDDSAAIKCVGSDERLQSIQDAVVDYFTKHPGGSSTTSTSN